MLTNSKIGVVLALAGLVIASPAFAQSARSGNMEVALPGPNDAPFLQQPGSDRRRLVWLQLDDPSRCLTSRQRRADLSPSFSNLFTDRGRPVGKQMKGPQYKFAAAEDRAERSAARAERVPKRQENVMSRQIETIDMERIKIAATPLVSSRIALGTWAMGGWMWGGTDEAESIRTIHEALDRGITLIDTAPVYGFGRSEEIVGKALAEAGRRQGVLIATKVGLDWKDANPFRNGSKARIVKEVEDLLRRLKTDTIDLYQVHWPDPKVPVEETAAAMAELYNSGKIRAIGVSNFSPAQMDAFRAIAPLHTAQPPYNLFERGIERDVLPYCATRNIVTLAYGSLCRGLLTGRMTAGYAVRRRRPASAGSEVPDAAVPTLP